MKVFKDGFSSRFRDLKSTTTNTPGSPVRDKNSQEEKSNSVSSPRKRTISTVVPKSRADCFNQLVASEDEFCGILTIFRDQYVKPIKDDSKLTKPVFFGRNEYQKVVVFFTNVEALLTLNSKFRDELKVRLEAGVGEVLEQYASLFQMYGQYASDYSFAVEVIAREMEINEKFASFVKQREESSGIAFIEILETPLDRIRVYQEFCSVFLEQFPGSDVTNLENAQTDLNRTNEFVQSQLAARVKLDRLKQLQKEWIGGNLLSGSITKARAFVMEGDLEKVSRKHSVKYRFLLFNDALVYGAPTSGGKVRFKRALDLTSMVIEDNGDVEEGKTFDVLTPTKSFKVIADSPEVKLLWVTEIKHQIELMKDFTSTEISHENVRPVFVPDTSSKSCMRCNVVFTMVRRRHHCRQCGKLVCAPCSRQRMLCQVTDSHDPTKKRESRVRVCNDCAEQRTEESKRQSQQQQNGEDDGGYPSSDDEKQMMARRGSSGSLANETHLVYENGEEGDGLVPNQVLTCICIDPRDAKSLQNNDEIILEVGDIVIVEEIYQGWATGTNQRTNEYGYFPVLSISMKDDGELPEFFDGLSSNNNQVSLAQSPPAPSAPIVSNPSLQLDSPRSDNDARRSSGSRDFSRGRTGSLSSTLGGSPSSSTTFDHLSRRSSTEARFSSEGGHHRRSSSKESIEEENKKRSSSVIPAATPLLTFTDKRSLIMNEIVVTERTYISALHTLLSVFVRPLMADHRSGKPQFGGGVLAVMNEAGDGAAMAVFMSRLEHIATLNTNFLNDLESRLAAWAIGGGGESASCTVGDVFTRYGPLFNLYDEYSSSYEFATKTLVDREKSDVKLAKFFESQSTTYASQLRNQTLLSLLITPIQRVPRYLLLLKEMQKHTTEDHPDYSLIVKGINAVSEVASHINEHIRERENTVLLREIEHELRTELTDNPVRIFIHRGDLIKQSRKKNENYHFLLFSDLLMYQKKASSGAVYSKPPKRLEIESLNVSDVADEENSKFAFDIVTKIKSFRVFCTTMDEKVKWMRLLNEALEAAGTRALSAKQSAPVWKQDTPTCEVCEAAFTFLFRRHHCRSCGKCVCDKCSKNRLLLPNVDENKELRVCQPCFDLRDTSKLEEMCKNMSNRSVNGGGVVDSALKRMGLQKTPSDRRLSDQKSPHAAGSIAKSLSTSTLKRGQSEVNASPNSSKKGVSMLELTAQIENMQKRSPENPAGLVKTPSKLRIVGDEESPVIITRKTSKLEVKEESTRSDVMLTRTVSVSEARAAIEAKTSAQGGVLKIPAPLKPPPIPVKAPSIVSKTQPPIIPPKAVTTTTSTSSSTSSASVSATTIDTSSLPQIDTEQLEHPKPKEKPPIPRRPASLRKMNSSGESVSKEDFDML